MEMWSSCIEACHRCAVACDECAAACLREADPQPLVHCIALDIDCAAACRFAAGVLSRRSEHATAVCDLCARLCDACAAECAHHAHDHCSRCAEACRNCVQACRAVAALAPHPVHTHTG